MLEKSFNHEYAGIAGDESSRRTSRWSRLDHVTNHANRSTASTVCRKCRHGMICAYRDGKKKEEKRSLPIDDLMALCLESWLSWISEHHYCCRWSVVMLLVPCKAYRRCDIDVRKWRGVATRNGDSQAEKPTSSAVSPPFVPECGARLSGPMSVAESAQIPRCISGYKTMRLPLFVFCPKFHLV